MGDSVTGPIQPGAHHAMERNFQRTTTKTLDTTVGNTPEIPMFRWSSGMIFIPNGSSITSLTFHAAPDEGGTYEALHDENDNAVTRTVAADRCYPLPDEVFAAGAIKIVVNSSGDVELCFKG